MKPWFILIGLSVALTAAATVAVPLMSSSSVKKELAYPAPAKRDGPAPAVQVVEDPVYNFGFLPQQYVGHHSWTIKNAGAGPLELSGAGSTCSCTTAALFGPDKKPTKRLVIPAGETYPLEVTFETKMWNNEKWSQSVTIATNDPNYPSVVLRVEGVVKPAITTVPGDPSISFGQVGNEDRLSRNIALFSNDRPDFKITKLVSNNPAMIEVTARPLTPEELATFRVEKGHVVEITLKPSSHLGAFAEEVLIETDHPQKSEFRYKVVGKVTGPISHIPERIVIRGATARAGGTEIVKVFARNRTAVHFTVEKKPQALELSIEPISQPGITKGSMYKMIVKLIPGTEPGRIVDEIVLTTDDPSATEVKIPVDILVQGSR